MMRKELWKKLSSQIQVTHIKIKNSMIKTTKVFSLFVLVQVTHQFSLRNFGDIPQELLTEVGDDIDADIIDLDSINEVFTKQLDNISSDKNVTKTAITIPKIPNKLPCLDVSGEDNPLKARMNKTPEIK